jgi:hypothetical protein
MGVNFETVGVAVTVSPVEIVTVDEAFTVSESNAVAVALA